MSKKPEKIIDAEVVSIDGKEAPIIVAKRTNPLGLRDHQMEVLKATVTKIRAHSKKADILRGQVMMGMPLMSASQHVRIGHIDEECYKAIANEVLIFKRYCENNP